MRHPGAPRQRIPRPTDGRRSRVETAALEAPARAAALGLRRLEKSQRFIQMYSSGSVRMGVDLASEDRISAAWTTVDLSALEALVVAVHIEGADATGYVSFNPCAPPEPPAPQESPEPTGRRGPGDKPASDPPEGEPNVWRVEKGGRGLYQGWVSSLRYEMQEDARHPLPTWDSALMAAFGGSAVWHSPAVVYQDWRFGFSSPEQLRAWIYRDDWRTTLDHEEFRVVCYRAEVLRIGDTQAMFLASSARRLYSLSLLEI